MENDFFVDSDKLSEKALEKKHRLENDPSSRTDHMAYMEGMEQISPEIREKVLSQMESYDYSKYTAVDVRRALQNDRCSVEDFKALLSPAAEPFLEEMAEKAKRETSKHFGNTVYLFTPLYIANYCENYCIYCGFNCYNDINRKRLSADEIRKEMKIIADSGIEEILMLTGESPVKSDVKYIGEACKMAKEYFRNVGLEIYPVNSEDYRYLHECGADYVTVFQETYDSDKYETLHLMGHKRVFPYRFEAQERALMGGMRGVGFSALLGLADFRKDALASAESIVSKDVYDAAVQGDKLAQEIFEFTGNILGEALADAIAFSSPEAIILFGGLAKSGDYIMKPIMKAMENNLLNIYKGKAKLLVSELKDSDAAVLGASALAWELKDLRD